MLFSIVNNLNPFSGDTKQGKQNLSTISAESLFKKPDAHLIVCGTIASGKTSLVYRIMTCIETRNILYAMGIEDLNNKDVKDGSTKRKCVPVFARWNIAWASIKKNPKCQYYYIKDEREKKSCSILDTTGLIDKSSIQEINSLHYNGEDCLYRFVGRYDASRSLHLQQIPEWQKKIWASLDNAKIVEFDEKIVEESHSVQREARDNEKSFVMVTKLPREKSIILGEESEKTMTEKMREHERTKIVSYVDHEYIENKWRSCPVILNMPSEYIYRPVDLLLFVCTNHSQEEFLQILEEDLKRLEVFLMLHCLENKRTKKAPKLVIVINRIDRITSEQNLNSVISKMIKKYEICDYCSFFKIMEIDLANDHQSVRDVNSIVEILYREESR